MMDAWRTRALESFFADECLGKLLYRASVHLNVSLVDFQLVDDFRKRYPGLEEEFAALYLMTAHYLNEGSMCVDMSSTDFIEKFKLLMGSKFQLMLERLKAGEFTAFLGDDETRVTPLICFDSFLYFYKNFCLETSLHKHCQRLLSRDATPADINDLKKSISRVLDSLPYDLHHRQLLGVLAGALNQFSIITGGPGTGKTSVLATLLRVLMYLPGAEIDKVSLVAPTGKAAQRMTDSIRANILSLEKRSLVDERLLELNASTIHRLVQSYNKTKKISLNIKVLVIDEVSMVDAQLMTDLLEALPNDCRVIFLGDKYQLPSVAAGQVLADLLPQGEPQYSLEFIDKVKEVLSSERFTRLALEESKSKVPLTDKLVLLTKSYRSAQEIVELSTLINSGEEKELNAFCQKGELLLLEDTGTTEGLPLFDFAQEDKPFPDNWFAQKASVQFYWEQFPSESFIYAWFDQCFRNGSGDYIELLRKSEDHYSDEKLDSFFIKIESSRILSLTRSGAYGVMKLNQIGAKYLRQYTGDFNHADFIHGAPIMITKNDYGRSLFNGDVGLILRSEGSFRAYFRREDSFVSFSVELLQDFEFSFAMTIHKSQGSEYNQVLIILPDNRDNRLLSREILYTGLTRAKDNCVIAGDMDIFRLGCVQKMSRQSRIRLWQEKA